MDESKYIALRDKLRARAKIDDLNQEFLRRFILALQHRVNYDSGREKIVCEAGSMDHGQFVPDTFTAYGSTMQFALKILFHDEKGAVLFEPVVSFAAKCNDKSFTVRCIDTAEEIEQVRSAASTTEGQKAVAALLERPLAKEVDEVIASLASA